MKIYIVEVAGKPEIMTEDESEALSRMREYSRAGRKPTLITFEETAPNKITGVRYGNLKEDDDA